MISFVSSSGEIAAAAADAADADAAADAVFSYFSMIFSISFVISLDDILV